MHVFSDWDGASGDGPLASLGFPFLPCRAPPKGLPLAVRFAFMVFRSTSLAFCLYIIVARGQGLN